MDESVDSWTNFTDSMLESDDDSSYSTEDDIVSESEIEFLRSENEKNKPIWFIYKRNQNLT